MKNFVHPDSIVRKIWQHTEVVLFIFGASAGGFALHKAVDWLFFTGKLPANPIGRLFSTVVYAQKIIFEEEDKALKTLQMMAQIHKGVEEARGFSIPNWAYQDVLYMLIAHSITCYELWERPLSEEEKVEVYAVFKRVGQGMGLQELPENYEVWLLAREEHLTNHFEKSTFSIRLFDAYQQQLGTLSYWLLCEIQKVLLPTALKRLLYENTTQPIRFVPKESNPTCTKKAIRFWKPYSFLPNKNTTMHTRIFVQLYKLVKPIYPFYLVRYWLLPKEHRPLLADMEKRMENANR